MKNTIKKAAGNQKIAGNQNKVAKSAKPIKVAKILGNLVAPHRIEIKGEVYADKGDALVISRRVEFDNGLDCPCCHKKTVHVVRIVESTSYRMKLLALDCNACGRMFNV